MKRWKRWYPKVGDAIPKGAQWANKGCSDWDDCPLSQRIIDKYRQTTFDFRIPVKLAPTPKRKVRAKGIDWKAVRRHMEWWEQRRDSFAWDEWWVAWDEWWAEIERAAKKGGRG